MTAAQPQAMKCRKGITDMLKLPINANAMGTFVFDGIEEVRDYKTKELKTNEAGDVQYRISTRYLDPDARKPESVDVKVFLPSMPNIEPYHPIAFSGLTAIYWENGSKSGISLSAEKVGYPQTRKVPQPKPQE